MAFPLACVESLLTAAGWPHQQGVFRKRRVVHALIALGAVRQLAEASAMLGATVPITAQRLFASMFESDKDWSDADSNELFEELDELSAQARSALFLDPFFPLIGSEFIIALNRPDEIAWDGDDGFTTPGNLIDVSVTRAYLRSLYWGLSKPDQVRRWMAAKDAGETLPRPLAKAAGVELAGESADVVAWFLDSIGAYEQVAPFPDAPPELVARLSVEEGGRFGVVPSRS